MKVCVPWLLSALSLRHSYPRDCLKPPVLAFTPKHLGRTEAHCSHVQAIEIIAGRFFFTPLRTTDGLRQSEIAHASLCFNIDNELVSQQWSLPALLQPEITDDCSS